MMSTQPSHERVKFWHAQELDKLELLHATYITHAFARHTHDGFAIGIIEQGAEGFYYRGAEYIAPAGSVVVINPGEVHTGQAVTKAGWTYRMLYPAIPLVQKAMVEITGRPTDIPNFPEPVIQDEYLGQLIRQLHLVLEDPATPALERESHFVSTLVQLINRHATRSPDLRPAGREHQAVRRVREYLEAHYAENVLLDQLAVIADLSPFHLLRTFRAETGLPPHAYLTQVRVERAKALLAQGWPAAQVAFETGFADQSHLTKRFKGIVGVAPGQYLPHRKNVQDKLA
jgi:AraC-like DNA-binding protein